jgi:hypothetical protein
MGLAHYHWRVLRMHSVRHAHDRNRLQIPSWDARKAVVRAAHATEDATAPAAASFGGHQIRTRSCGAM